MSDRVVIDGDMTLTSTIDGEGGTFYKVNPTSEALTVSPTGEDVTYTPTADYFSEVTVEGIKGERTITENGDYDVLADKQVTVAVDTPVLDPLTATANGHYTPTHDGYSEVTVNVPPDTVPLNATANGEYTRAGGYNPVMVAIPEYEGAYTVEPSTTEQILATAGKVMTGDVTIEKAKSFIALYSSIKIEEYKSYSTFNDFKNAVVPDLPIDRDIVIIDFVNNTSNSRAGVWWVAKSFQKDGVVSGGKRVGGQFEGGYGCDVYAGATINVYVGTY